MTVLSVQKFGMTTRNPHRLINGNCLNEVATKASPLSNICCSFSRLGGHPSPPEPPDPEELRDRDVRRRHHEQYGRRLHRGGQRHRGERSG